jgi:hypothetical protein
VVFSGSALPSLRDLRRVSRHYCVAHLAFEEAALWYMRRKASRKEYLCVVAHNQVPPAEAASWLLHDERD